MEVERFMTILLGGLAASIESVIHLSGSIVL